MRGANQRRYGGWGLKKVHRTGESLMARCLRDGTLDVNLSTGQVMSSARGGKWKPIKTRVDEDGYIKFSLAREDRRRKPNREGRRRRVETVFVHRVVMVKKLAVAAGETRWREKVADLSGRDDVHHRNHIRGDNRATNLTLELSEVNRGNRIEEPEYEEAF